MTQRVLVNLHAYDPDLEPYWAFVPISLVNYPPKQPPKQRQPPNAPKAFANPYSYGYGGGESPWPFDHNRAYSDGRYRAGIRNALKSDWTASHWKHYAAIALRQVQHDIANDDLLGWQRTYINRSNYSTFQINFESVFLYLRTLIFLTLLRFGCFVRSC